MTSANYERLINWLASLLIVGVWLGCAWLLSLVCTGWSIDRCFLAILALTLAERLPFRRKHIP